jgi:glutathione S-transferase
MELLDEWHTDGFVPMLPTTKAGQVRYQSLSRLERELFSWWCTLLFRPETGNNGSGLSPVMKGFIECLEKVNKELLSTSGPWFFDDINTVNAPSMIDFIFVSHIERMLASCARWKGLNLRDKNTKYQLQGIQRWLEAFDRRPAYLAFKSDYFTNVMDIPPQYGPGFDGGFDREREQFTNMICGHDRDPSWRLPLPHDDPLQPLYFGPPLPLPVLEANGIKGDVNGSYESCDPKLTRNACREMAAWKVCSNGMNIVKFAARGGPKGSKNPRANFAAPLADP